MKRKIIEIDEKLCDGCGLCIPNCPEGAIRILDGKARLLSDRFCDGLGACLGHCPQGAITVLEREAEPYDESLVMENIIKAGPETIQAHLEHLKDHGETALYNEAVLFLKKKGLSIEIAKPAAPQACGCPGSANKVFQNRKAVAPAADQNSEATSALTHWPVQLHLISPGAPQYSEADVLLAADCAAFAAADFHTRHLPGKALAIGCPKLDSDQDIYREKITALIDEANIRSLHVVIMQVPCCRGLLQLALEASQNAKRKIPIRAVVLSLEGTVLSERSIQ